MYNKLTDEQILQKYRAGDKMAVEFLMRKYKNLVSKIARSYFLIGSESDDLLQEAQIGLYSACQAFEDSKSSFKSFATLCITRAIQTAVKNANRQKYKLLNESLTLNNQGAVIFDGKDEEDEEVSIYVPSTVLDPEDRLLQEEQKQELNTAINNNLSSKEKRVLTLYLNGYSYVEIASRTNSTTKAVDNAIARTKRKLEKLLK